MRVGRRSRLLSPVVNFSLFSFSFYSINKQRCDAILWLISILSNTAKQGTTRQMYI
jgi:hypothetical protein